MNELTHGGFFDGRRCACAWVLFIFFSSGVRGADPIQLQFEAKTATHRLALKELDPRLVSDFSPYNFLVVELKASSPQRFELGFDTPAGNISKRIHPFPNVWIRAAIPLDFYRHAPGNGFDLASTMNKPRGSYWINVEHGGYGALNAVTGVTFRIPVPVGHPVVQIRSAELARDDPGDAVLDGKPLIDEFGQYIHADWKNKAHSLADLKAAWVEESQALAGAHDGDRGRYGGFVKTSAAASGFFHVQQIDGRWWFVDPDGHLFFSTGANGIAAGGGRGGPRSGGKNDLYAVSPRGGSFYGWNLARRFGTDVPDQWAHLTLLRMEAWGLNTISGRDAHLAEGNPRKAYVLMLRNWQTGGSIMGMPDVYAGDFAARVDESAAAQCTALADDPWLVGYFIGNEPPWPGRESMLVDLILAGKSSAIQTKLKAYLQDGDTLEKARRAFVIEAFKHYLAVINQAVKKHDPNHLNLGIRFGGNPPDDVIACASVFDVYSHNIYAYAPDPAFLDKLYRLTGRPILIGEFHIGAPQRGMAAGLVQAADQTARGVAYQYYLEHAAAHRAVVGAHWFQWLDEAALGRGDGENYNIGMIDVTDRPYEEMVRSMKTTHRRLLDVHSGRILPTDRLPEGKGLED